MERSSEVLEAIVQRGHERRRGLYESNTHLKKEVARAKGDSRYANLMAERAQRKAVERENAELVRENGQLRAWINDVLRQAEEASVQQPA